MERRVVLASTIVLFMMVGGCLGDETKPQGLEAASVADTFISDVKGDAVEFLDVLSGRFIESQEELVVEFQVQNFDPSTVVSKLAAGGYQAAGIQLCWNPRSAPTGGMIGQECAGVRVERAEKNALFGHYSMYYGPFGGCNDWQWCEWHVPFSAEGSNPTTIRVAVPRGLLANGTAGHDLKTPFLESRVTKLDPANPLSPTGQRFGVRACALTCANRQLIPFTTSIVDGSESAPSYTLQMEFQRTLPSSQPRTILYDSEREWTGYKPYDPKLDVISVDIEETSSHVAYLVKVASLPMAPTHDFDMELAVEGITYEAWYSAKGGVVHDALMGYCTDTDCSVWKESPVTVGFQPGTPGTIRVAIPWSAMESPKAGSLITLAEAEIGEPGKWQGVPFVVGSVWANTNGYWDSAWFAEPYYLTMGAGS